MNCVECYAPEEHCLCSVVDEFMDDNEELMRDLAELEAKEAGKHRCLACFFFNCRCKSGHGKR